MQVLVIEWGFMDACDGCHAAAGIGAALSEAMTHD